MVNDLPVLCGMTDDVKSEDRREQVQQLRYIKYSIISIYIYFLNCYGKGNLI